MMDRRIGGGRHFYSWITLCVSGGCLILSVAAGMLAGVATSFPDYFSSRVSLLVIQPIHTFLALSWLFGGMMGLIGLLCSDETRTDRLLASAIFFLYVFFVSGSLLSLLLGNFSGREYLSWPPWLSVPLVAAFVASAVIVARGWRRLSDASPEAAWLLLLGVLLCPAGMLESHLYLLPDNVTDPGRDLAIQWHALDTLIAGWSIILYAVGILTSSNPGKPMRSGWLFVLAGIGILFDFGHHNYPSPQPHYFKVVSFAATMLAAVSFVRHVRALSRHRIATSWSQLLQHVEFWTLFAVGTGILMAIPQLNAYVHGTYGVVGHTMGSILGVNSLLILLSGFRLAGIQPRSLVSWLRGFSYSLGAFCLVFFVLGAARGLMRIDMDFAAYNQVLRPFYIAIPLAGIPLAGSVVAMGWRLVRACVENVRSGPWSRASRHPSIETETVGDRIKGEAVAETAIAVTKRAARGNA